MTDLNAVSLFAGVGGFDIALERNGIRIASAVEIDNSARGVLRLKFKKNTIFKDVRGVSGDELQQYGFVPERGILVGGFPCQDLSLAGERAGLAGERSGLFWEILRIADETKPKWILLENVPGLLSSNGVRDMGTVVGELVKRGYGISWRVLDSKYFGVPQSRSRVFIVGYLGDDGRASAKVLFEKGNSRDSARERNGIPTSFGNGLKTNIEKPFLDPSEPEVFGRSGYGRYSLGIKSLAATSYKRPDENMLVIGEGSNTIVRKFTPIECERLQGFPDDWTKYRFNFKTGQIIEQSSTERYKQMGNAVCIPVVDWIIKRIVKVDSEMQS